MTHPRQPEYGALDTRRETDLRGVTGLGYPIDRPYDSYRKVTDPRDIWRFNERYAPLSAERVACRGVSR